MLFERALLLLVVSCITLTISTKADDSLVLLEEDDSVIDIYAISSDVLGLNDQFTFSCNASTDYIISVLVDDSLDSPKLDRLTNKTYPADNKVEFYFSGLIAYDNGTTFMCTATLMNKTDLSNVTDVLTLQVIYPPMFVEGSNVSVLSELPTDKDSTLKCTVSMANPPITHLNFTNTSKHYSNVHGKFKDGSVGEITFTKAAVNNKGDYTCIADNGVGVTNLTYTTYVGGPPDKLSVNPDVFDISKGQLTIKLNITDTSDAPALSLEIMIGNFITKTINFKAEDLPIPVHTSSYKALEQDLNMIEAANYTMIIMAINMLGNTTVYNETVFIPGTGIKVNISSMMSNVTQGHNYTFNCTSDHDDTTFTVEVDYTNTTEKTKRIVEGKKGKGFAEFMFVDTTYRDNGTVLKCVANKMYRSEDDYVIVLYPPVYYSNGTEMIKGLNGSSNVTINIQQFTSNPPPTKYTWYRDGKEIKSSKRVTIKNATALVFNPLLQEDYGKYMVKAENDIGKGNGSANIDVEWPPYLASPVMIPIQRANKGYEVVLNISANPDISFYQWMRGNEEINDTNVVPGFTTLTFTSLRPIDNGSYTAILYNEVGNITVNFDMMVYYAPTIFAPRSVGGFMGSNQTVLVIIDANPTNYTYEWMKDGKELKSTDNVEVKPKSITFKNLTSHDSGVYTITVSNIIGNASNSFVVAVYDGPFFVEGSPNTTNITEHKPGTDFNMTCTVKTSVPPVEELKIEPSKGANWKTVKTSNNSVTLMITNATMKDNTRKFTCSATNNVTTSTLAYNNFIGGVPNKMDVNVTKTVDDDNTVRISFKVTDNSDAPATELLVFLKEIMKENRTIPLTGYPLNGTSISFKDEVTVKYGQLETGTNVVKIYGGNMIGYAHIKDYTFTSPSKPTPKPPKPKTKSSHTGLIVGVTIPLVIVAILVIVGVVGFFYYRRRRVSGEYAPLSVQDGNNQYGTD